MGELVRASDEFAMMPSDRLEPRDISSVAPVAVGQLIGGRYEVRSVIAHGGMGVVCEATHVELGVSVAVKFIHPELAQHPAIVQRFLNEARTAAGLRSEHVARVYDAGRLDSGEPYLVMERLEGTGLDTLLNGVGALQLSNAVDVILQACEGLAEAHAVGLVHRDIKPGNLFMTRRPDGRPFVKLLDFGIAKRLADSRVKELTDPRSSIGSPWYMSPEQMRNASTVNQRTDIWALGVVLFELLTGTRPFEGETVTEVCANVLTGTAPALGAVLPGVSPVLEGIVSTCLQSDPEKRYPTVAALAECLAPFGSGREMSVAAQVSCTLVPTEGNVDHGRTLRWSRMAAMGFAALGVGAALGSLADNVRLPSYSGSDPFLGSSLNLGWPSRPALRDSHPADEVGLESAWSPPALVLAGAQGRVLAEDAAGRPSAAAELEVEIAPPPRKRSRETGAFGRASSRAAPVEPERVQPFDSGEAPVPEAP